MAQTGKKINELTAITTVSDETVLPAVYVSGGNPSATANKVSIEQISNKITNDLSTILNSKQDKLTAGNNITIESNVISATDTQYTAGTNITISEQNVISADVDALPSQTGQSGKFLTTDGTDASWAEVNIPNNVWTQDNLKAGDNVTITQVEKPVIDSNTVELLHFNDDAIDSISNETLTSQITTYSIGKFDKAAQNLTNFTIAFNTPVSFTKGNSYYTIDCWISSNASGDYNRKLKLLSSVSLDCINFGTNSVEIYRAFNNGSQDITVNYPNNITLEVGVWHHFALVGNGTQTLMFFDGKLFYSTSYTEGNEPIAFYGFTGRMDVDELRISNVARWTSDFTPFSQPYAPASGPTEYQINAIVPQTSSAPTLTWYTGNTGTTVTIADTTSASLVKVYKNGILLQPTEDYSISGTTLTLVSALESQDKITTEVFA